MKNSEIRESFMVRSYMNTHAYVFCKIIIILASTYAKN